MRPFLLTVGILMIAVSPARADEIRLRNGSFIHGKIIREDKEVVIIDLGRGRMSVARRDIVSIKRTGDAETVGSTDTPGDPAAPGEPRKGSDAPHDAIPAPKGGIPRVAPQVARKKKDKAGPGPKVVPVERTPAQARRTSAPESASPSRKSATKAAGSPGTPVTGAKATAQRPSVKPDW